MDLPILDKNALYRFAIVMCGLILIIIGSVTVLEPFIPALIWALILCLTAWPAYQWVLNRIPGKKAVAALIMTLVLTICFLGPLIFLGSSLAENFGNIYSLLISALKNHPKTAPIWISELPWIGESLRVFWEENLADTDSIVQSLKTYSEPVSQFLIALGAGIGRGLLDLSLGILIAFFFFRDGAAVAARLSTLLDRFIGARGHHLVDQRIGDRLVRLRMARELAQHFGPQQPMFIELRGQLHEV